MANYACPLRDVAATLDMIGEGVWPGMAVTTLCLALDNNGWCASGRLLLIAVICRSDSLGGELHQGSIKQAFAIALGCRFENVFGQRGFAYRGSLFWLKAGPGIVKDLLQEGDGFGIKIHALFVIHDHLSVHALMNYLYCPQRLTTVCRLDDIYLTV
jgi:hypothetical protein